MTLKKKRAPRKVSLFPTLTKRAARKPAVKAAPVRRRTIKTNPANFGVAKFIVYAVDKKTGRERAVAGAPTQTLAVEIGRAYGKTHGCPVMVYAVDSPLRGKGYNSPLAVKK